MNSEREKADILFDYGLPLQFCCHLIQFYTLLFLCVATLTVRLESKSNVKFINLKLGPSVKHKNQNLTAQNLWV